LSEEKITRLREVFLETMNKFLKEQKLPKSVTELSRNEQLFILIGNTMKLDDLLYDMCKLGISGAKLRGASSEEIKEFMKELRDVSKELRASMASSNIEKAVFLNSQFQLLHRRIIKSVGNMLSPKPLYEFSKKETMPIVSRNIFIVHGRDDKPKLELARMLEKLGFNAIILSEQADKGRTIIEKLEEETIDIGYVFVILTPDDIGLQDLIKELSKQFPLASEFVKNHLVISQILNSRARQNVILELGYFVGKIGRNRVCCLYKGDVELPSDIHGVLFKRFDKSVEECYKKILEELKAAGYKIKL
jgi:predicted nucleotide-binding protein